MGLQPQLMRLPKATGSDATVATADYVALIKDNTDWLAE